MCASPRRSSPSMWNAPSSFSISALPRVVLPLPGSPYVSIYHQTNDSTISKTNPHSSVAGAQTRAGPVHQNRLARAPPPTVRSAPIASCGVTRSS